MVVEVEVEVEEGCSAVRSISGHGTSSPSSAFVSVDNSEDRCEPDGVAVFTTNCFAGPDVVVRRNVVSLACCFILPHRVNRNLLFNIIFFVKFVPRKYKFKVRQKFAKEI